MVEATANLSFVVGLIIGLIVGASIGLLVFALNRVGVSCDLPASISNAMHQLPPGISILIELEKDSSRVIVMDDVSDARTVNPEKPLPEQIDRALVVGKMLYEEANEEPVLSPESIVHHSV